MKKHWILMLTLMASFSAIARPLNCIVTFADGSRFEDFKAENQHMNSGDLTQYALVNKNGFSFYANEYKSTEVLNLVIINNEKTHLGNSPMLVKRGQRACLTIDLGLNEQGHSKKVSISCDAL